MEEPRKPPEKGRGHLCRRLLLRADIDHRYSIIERIRYVSSKSVRGNRYAVRTLTNLDRRPNELIRRSIHYRNRFTMFYLANINLSGYVPTDYPNILARWKIGANKIGSVWFVRSQIFDRSFALRIDASACG
jgi:hypothetical protein